MGTWVVDNAAALWGATFLSILILSLLPADGSESEVGSSWIWNLGHVPAYAVLAAVTVLALSRRGPVGGPMRVKAGVAVLSLAIALELVQPMVGRTASVKDALFGGLGIVMGLWLQAAVAARIAAVSAKGRGRHGLR